MANSPIALARPAATSPKAPRMVRRCWTRHSDPPRSRPRTISMGAGRPLRAEPRPVGRALLHHDAAAERHRRPAHGSCGQLHAAGHAGPLSPDAGPRGAVAARQRSCRHRDPDGGRAPAGAEEPARDRPRGVHRAGLEVEGAVGRHHQPAAAPPGRVRRLVARPLHHGRGPVRRGPEGVRRPLSRRPDLQGQAAGQLGLRAADRGLGPRGRADRGRRPSLVHPLPDRGHAGPPHRGRDHAARDHAGRYRRSRSIRTIRATRTWSAGTPCCRWSAAACRSSPTATPIPRRARARSRSRRATISTTSRSAAGTTWP